MNTLDEIKGRCRIDADTGCWIWIGALSEGKWPRVHAPNHSLPGSPKVPQTGRRAVWHAATGEAIPKGWRVYGKCTEALCLNPKHMACGPSKEWGEHLRKTGAYKDNPLRIAANRVSGRSRSHVTPELYQEVINSSETGVSLAAKTGLPRQTISKIRTGQMACMQPVGGLFSGLLMASNESSRRRA